jgi:pre-mRNA-splicing factor CWC26
MTDGTTTGLVDAATVVKEADEKRKIARARVMAMKDDQSGQGFRF